MRLPCKRTEERISFERCYGIVSGRSLRARTRLGNAASIDRSGDRQVVVPINDLFLAGAFAALLEQLHRILAFHF
jgi:hypothetical protein